MGIITLSDTAAMLAVFWVIPALLGGGIVLLTGKWKGGNDAR